jgi:hypothetical protein
MIKMKVKIEDVLPSPICLKILSTRKTVAIPPTAKKLVMEVTLPDPNSSTIEKVSEVAAIIFAYRSSRLKIKKLRKMHITLSCPSIFL